MDRIRRFLAAAAAAWLIGGAPARAASIALGFSGEVTGAQAVDFRIAAAYWGSVLTNPETIRLDVVGADLGADSYTLGDAYAINSGVLPVDQFEARLAATQTSALDHVAVADLPPLTSTTIDGHVYKYVTPLIDGPADPATGYGVDTTAKAPDTTIDSNNLALNVNSANLKALGYTGYAGDPNAFNEQSDGQLLFNASQVWTTDPSRTIAAGSYDLLAVAVHEIGHELGFTSGVDDYDYYGYPNGEAAAYAADPNTGFDLDDYVVATPQDLFRYSAAGLDWTVGTASYFSIDGESPLFGNAYFSTGIDNGDGSGASHWAPEDYGFTADCDIPSSPAIGVMAPYFGRCQEGAVTADDLAVLDAIGYNLPFDILADPGYEETTGEMFAQFRAAVPEPGAWLLMLMGCGGIGAALRRKRRAIFPVPPWPAKIVAVRGVVVSSFASTPGGPRRPTFDHHRRAREISHVEST